MNWPVCIAFQSAGQGEIPVNFDEHRRGHCRKAITITVKSDARSADQTEGEFLIEFPAP